MTTTYATLTRNDVQREVRSIKEHGKEINSSPLKARAFLIRAGILQKDGKRVTKRYRS